MDGGGYVQGEAVVAHDPGCARVGHDSNQKAKIICRYRADLLPTDRIIHNGRAYQLFGLLQDLSSGIEYITIPCGSGLNTGE